MTPDHTDSFEVGTQPPAGQYRCVACGHTIKIRSNESLPTCPNDDGLHSAKAWRPVDSEPLEDATGTEEHDSLPTNSL